MFIKGLNIYHIIIIILLGIIGYSWVIDEEELSNEEYIKVGGKEYLLLKNARDTLYLPQETIIIHDTLPAPPAKIIKVEVPVEIDTLAILQDYYSKYIYNNTYPLDSIGSVTVKDTISQNKIISRSLIFDYDIPLIRETVTVQPKPQLQFYLGGGMNLNNSLYASALVVTKKNRIFTINGGISTINSSITPYIGAGIYFKIR